MSRKISDLPCPLPVEHGQHPALGVRVRCSRRTWSARTAPTSPGRRRRGVVATGRALPPSRDCCALALHGLGETGLVDRGPPSACYFPGELDGETMGVVQLEGGRPADAAPPSSSASSRLIPERRLARKRSSSRPATPATKSAFAARSG